MQHLSMVMRSGYDTREVTNFNAQGYRVMEGFYPNPGDTATVTDRFDVYLTFATETELIDRVRTVELAIDFAKEHPSGPDGVWFYYSPDTDTLDPWRSRVLSGAVMHDEKLQRRFDVYEMKMEVVIERVAYFETLEPVDTNFGAGIVEAIENHTDAAHSFWATVPGAQVYGGLPTPAIIRITNNTNDAKTIDNIYVGHFSQSKPISDPAVLTLVLEGSGTGDGNCSGGAYKICPWLGATENQLAYWSLPTESLLQRYFKFAARFRDTFVYTDLYLQVRIMHGNIVLAKTRWELMSAGKELQLIGSLKIPPFKHGTYVNLGNLTIALYEKRIGGNGTINLDYIALLPQDSWRKFSSISNLNYGEQLVDNPVDDIILSVYGASYFSGASYIEADVTHIAESGGPIMLRPDVDNMLCFLHDCTDGTAEIARTCNVYISFHPRRRTV